MTSMSEYFNKMIDEDINDVDIADQPDAVTSYLKEDRDKRDKQKDQETTEKIQADIRNLLMLKASNSDKGEVSEND